jgi:Tol biopolymer transport system component
MARVAAGGERLARRRVPRSGDGFAGRASSIVFVSWPLRSGATAQLWTIDADGTRLHRLPGTPKGNDLDPSWLPGGKRIVFVRERYLPKIEQYSDDVYEISVDGRGLR